MRISSNFSSFSLKAKSQEISFTFGTGITFHSAMDPAQPFAGNQLFKIEVKKIAKQETKEDEKDEKDHSEENESGLVLTGDAGEENEKRIYEGPAKLFVLETGSEGETRYASKGNGILHLNTSDDFDRIVLRNGLGNVCLNTRVFETMMPTIIKEKNIKFIIPHENEIQVNLLQFKSAKEAKELLGELQKCIDKRKSAKITDCFRKDK